MVDGKEVSDKSLTALISYFANPFFACPSPSTRYYILRTLQKTRKETKKDLRSTYSQHHHQRPVVSTIPPAPTFLTRQNWRGAEKIKNKGGRGQDRRLFTLSACCNVCCFFVLQRVIAKNASLLCLDSPLKNALLLLLEDERRCTYHQQ